MDPCRGRPRPRSTRNPIKIHQEHGGSRMDVRWILGEYLVDLRWTSVGACPERDPLETTEIHSRSTQDPPRSTRDPPRSTQDPLKIHSRSTQDPPTSPQDPPDIHPRSTVDLGSITVVDRDPPRSTRDPPEIHDGSDDGRPML